MDDQYDTKEIIFSWYDPKAFFLVVKKLGWEPVKVPQTGKNSAKQQFLVEASVIFGIIEVLVSFGL